MTLPVKPLVAATLMATLGLAGAQELTAATAAATVSAQPHNVLQLSASASVDALQDTLRVSLMATRDGEDPAAVQEQLKRLLDAALVKAKAKAAALTEPGASPTEKMEVRTGRFSLSPRYDRGGKINNWQGSAELILEGTDFAAITQASGDVRDLVVNDVAFTLSRQKRAASEVQAQSLAIRQFRTKAAALTRELGFADYSLRDVSVSANESGVPVTPMMVRQMGSASVASAPLPVEAGKSTVTVTVSGSVQLK
ncbi:MAG: SIMPL domain-containing protein [Variovorax sp.]